MIPMVVPSLEHAVEMKLMARTKREGVGGGEGGASSMRGTRGLRWRWVRDLKGMRIFIL